MATEFFTLAKDQIDRLPRDKTVFFIPVGPMEDHGPHLPVGLDGLIALNLCKRMAEKLEAEKSGWHSVILPNVPIGVETNTSVLRLKVRSHVLRDYLIDLCEGLHHAGFRYFVCFTGHPGPKQLTTIEEASVWLRRRTGGFFSRKGAVLVSAMSGLVTRKQVMKSPLNLDPEEHGGALDTSIAQVVAPSLVGGQFRELQPRILPKSAWQRNWLRKRNALEGYWGSPATADVKAGEHWLKETVDAIFPKLQSVLSGDPVVTHFKSWYSVIPANRSLFRVWLLFWLVLFLVGAWILVVLGSFDA
ncbi:MAG: creatininase family protein [Bdellovibrionales bacterium]|nr:creatininase family protein [Bdellovibrionales bacterium]